MLLVILERCFLHSIPWGTSKGLEAFQVAETIPLLFTLKF